ncbi:MAG: phospholipase, partial [Mycobacterium sp.]|nr:phospholipase [Mycobacterium sp.]
MTISRRRFIGAAGAAGALAATGGLRSMARAVSPGLAARSAAVPLPDASGIDHIVVVMMENRSFDHFLGWMPGADGVQSGAYVDSDGTTYDLSQQLLTGEYNGCAHPDPDHSWEGGRYQLNGGALNGFASGANDAFAIGHYQESDRPFMSALARNFTTLDRYHCSILAETFPNRFFMHSAQTDRLHNNGIASTTISPTIWDRLAAKGVSAKYYFSDVPFIGLWGTTYLSISHTYADFLVDALAGTLPAVSFI